MFSKYLLTIKTIDKNLVALDNSKGSGQVRIAAGVLKSCHLKLSALLYHSFTLSLTTGIFLSGYRQHVIN